MHSIHSMQQNILFAVTFHEVFVISCMRQTQWAHVWARRASFARKLQADTCNEIENAVCHKNSIFCYRVKQTSNKEKL